jgi:MFS transporter, DHA1 family, tetracycline resistance protein
MSMPKYNWKSSFPLMLVLFIDGMGIAIVFPILNSILLNPHSSFLSVLYSNQDKNIFYALVLAVFLFSAFFASTLLGDLSDQIGRKKTLLICLIGSAFSFVLTAIAFIAHSLTLLFIGRAVDGFTTGSQPIAQAAILDINDGSKVRSIGYIYCALSAGLVAGPLLAGVLMNKSLVSWFSLATVMWFAAIISISNAFLLLLTYKEKKYLLIKKTNRSVTFYQVGFCSF